MNDFDWIFTHDLPLIDVRAPVEFEAGHFPESRNLPILDDGERKLVGTCYREKGADSAIQLGHQLVHGETKEKRIRAWRSFFDSNPSARLYCFRGGLRSGIAVQWLKDSGCEVPRIEGGYKALRNHLLLRLSEVSQRTTFFLIGGKTGSGKTAFLTQSPIPAIDLEALACHRGSSFGAMGPQPSQATFENALAVELLKKSTGSPILLEDESVMIGSLLVPEVLFLRMKQAPVFLLEVGLEERILNLAREYVETRLVTRGEPKEQVRDFFVENLRRIRKKLGGMKHASIESMIHTAFGSGEVDRPETHSPWIRELLLHYYDPLYERGLERSKDRILHRGDGNELASKLLMP